MLITRCSFLTEFSFPCHFFSAPPCHLLVQYALEAAIILIYGFERCSMDVVSSNASHSPFYDLHLAMANVNISLMELAPKLEFYLSANGVNDTLIDDLVIKISAAENATEKMFRHRDPDFKSTSYIMSHFGLTENDLLPCILALLVFFIVFRAIAYVILYLKSTPKK